MKTMLVIPDYLYGINNWELERSYFKCFSNRAKSKEWRLVNIQDSISLNEIDCIFAPNYAKYLDKIHNFEIYDKIINKLKIPKILAIFETPSRRPDLWESTRWFDVCISFNKKPGKYCHCKHVENPYPYNFSENECIYKDWNSRNSMVWVASNNWFQGFDSLSQRRLRDFDIFAKKLSGKISIFGKGWDIKPDFLFGPLPIFGILQNKKNKIIYDNISKYFSGLIENKNKEISGYKFCFSYENTDNFPGYVTEKVFDAWMSGSIPIYRGEREFEETYNDLLICPRLLGKKKTIEMMHKYNDDDAYNMISKFQSMLIAGKFKNFSHEVFQDRILDTANSLI